MASLKVKLLFIIVMSLYYYSSCQQSITVTGIAENSKETVRISIEGNSLVSDKNIFSNSNTIPIFKVKDSDSGNIEKSLSVPFGDVSKGVFSKLSLPFEPSWKICGNEDSICRVDGKSIIRYGERNVYVYKLVESDIACSYTIFGDPLFGVHKKCDVFDISDYLNNTSQAVTLQNFYGPENKRIFNSIFSSIRLVWTFCSYEHGTCKINTNSIVRYGHNNVFVYTYASNDTICNNEKFGDPLYGTFKKCDYIVLDDLTNRGINLVNPFNESLSIYNNLSAQTPINWVYCSPEWGTCNISARSIVRYGEHNNWRYLFTNTSVSCTNDFFGDPLYGTFKKCEFFVVSRQSGNLSLNTSNWLSEPFGNSSNQIYKKVNPFVQINWTNCANENEFCSFVGKAIVRYGKNNVFNYKIFENGQQCSNDRFGDPLYGIVKFCSYFIISNINQESFINLAANNWLKNIENVDNNIYKNYVPPYTPNWRRCAGQNELCTVSKMSVIRYGAEPNYRYTITNNNIICTHLIFGDPFFGVNKDCYIHEINLTPSLLSNSATFNAPENWLSNSFLGKSFRNLNAPPHINLNWVRCSTEYQHCYPGRKSIVRYGERDVWTYKIVDDNISCNNEFFGDPLFGIVKVCDFVDLTRFTLNSIAGVTRLNLVPESWLSNPFVDKSYNNPWQHIPGKLKQISVGADGRVWGVNSADDIWTRDGVNGTWVQIDGKLKHISVGFDGRVWGVNSADDIWTRDGVNGNWQHIPGKLKNISVAADGRVWGTNSFDEIYTRSGVNGDWRLIPGYLKWISATNNGSVWGVNRNDDIFTRNGIDGDWLQVPGKLINIEGSSAVVNRIFHEQELIWGVNASNQIFAREGADGQWKLIPGRLVNISVGKNGRVWGINENDDIFTRLGINGDWQNIPGKLTNISVNSHGRVWGVNRNNDIFTRNDVDGEWQHIPGKLKNISVSEDGRVWGVNSADDIFTRDGVDGEWQHIPGKLSNISVASDGRVWGVNSSYNIFTRDGVSGDWQHIPGGLKQITTAPNGRVWGINLHGEIFIRNGVNGEWLQIPGRLMNISGCSSKTSFEKSGHNVVWGVNSANDIFVRDGADGSWRWIEGKLKNISVGLDGRVWGVNSNDDIFTREGFSNVFKTLNSPIEIDWERCSSEYQRCVLNERSLIRYGERGTFVYKLMDTTFDCSNGVFGDPLYGIVKVCDFFPLSKLTNNKQKQENENLNVLNLNTISNNVLLVTKNDTDQFNLNLKEKMINIKSEVKRLKQRFTELASELATRVDNLNRTIKSNNDRSEAIKRRNAEIDDLTKQIAERNIRLRDANDVIKKVETSISNLNSRKNEITTKMNEVNSVINSNRNLIDNFKISFDIAVKKETLLKEFETIMNNIEFIQPYLGNQIGVIIKNVRSKKYDAFSINSFFISPN